MKDRIRGVLAVVGSLAIGTGAGLAMAGRGPRAIAWLGAVLVSCSLLVVTVWALPVALAVHVACTVDTYRVATVSPRPLRLLDLWVGAVVVVAIGTALVLRATIVEAFKIPSSAMYPTLHIGDHIFIDKLSPHWRSPGRGEVIVFVYPCDHDRDYIKRVIGLPGDTIEVRCNVVYVNGTAETATLVEATASYEDYDERNGSWFARQCSRYHDVLDGRGFDTFHDAERPTRDQHLADAIEGDSRDFPSVDHAHEPSCKYAEDTGSHVDEILGKLVATKPEAKPCEPQLHYVVPPDHLFVMGDNRNNSNDSRVWGGVPLANVKGRVTGIWWSHGAHGIDWGRFGAIH